MPGNVVCVRVRLENRDELDIPPLALIQILLDRVGRIDENGDSGVLVANSGRGFRHERECRYNLDQFRASVPTAPTSDGEVPLEFPWQRHSADVVQTTGGVT